MARGLRGVKDDLTEIARHLLDIACFFSPHIATTYADSPPSSPKSGDLPAVGGAFRIGISRLSSVLRRYGERDRRSGGDGLVEVREEVLGFVRDLVKSPESWAEFPVPVDDDFAMSNDQKEHIATVERLVPSLAALRISLCPSFMNEDRYWKIYFALLHPKLNNHESGLLSTQQIVEEMRTNLKKKLQDRLNSHTEVPVAESSSSAVGCSEIQPADEDEVHAPIPATENATLQYIDQWFERGGMALSSHKIRADSEEEDNNVVVLNKYKSSSSTEAAVSFGNSPFSSFERLQFLDRPLLRRQVRGSTDGDSSDFELVERS